MTNDIKRDIRAAMGALYPEAIKQAETPQCWSHTPERQRRLDSITIATQAFCNDGGEAAEIVAAIATGLKHRYDDCTEALLYLSMAKFALERLDVGYQVEAKEELEALLSLSAKAARRVP